MKLFFNGQIYAPHRSDATAMIIDHGCFVLMGSDDELLNGPWPIEQQIDLKGKTVWPGLIDAHVHLMHLAESMAMVDCETKTIKTCLNRIQQAARHTMPGAWVRGHGWNQNEWEAGYGSAQELDRVTAGHPAYLTAKSLHAAWANSEALALAGIDPQTPDPPGGIIQRDHAGHPTGILLEAGAMRLVESVIPAPTHAEQVSQIKALLPELWRLGLTGVHDFDGINCWQALQACAQDEALPFRVCKNIPFDSLEAFIAAGLRTHYGSDHLHIGHVKLFADGALGPQTAAMKAPYQGSSNLGTLLLTEDQILEIGKYAADHGLGLAIHAIGDQANHIVLNAFAKLRAYEEMRGLPQLHHRIEHVQIIEPSDLCRLAKLNITASVQPVHAPSDRIMADRYLGDRSKNAYAYQAMVKSGASFVLGSDAPVEPVNPFQGIHAAVTRQNLKGQPAPDGWHPEQRLSLAQALEGFSIRPAVLTQRGDHFGEIKPGLKADFIILEQNPFEIPPADLFRIKPLVVLIEGMPVYLAEALDGDIKGQLTP